MHLSLGFGLGGGLRGEDVASLSAGDPPDIERNDHKGNDREQCSLASAGIVLLVGCHGIVRSRLSDETYDNPSKQ